MNPGRSTFKGCPACRRDPSGRTLNDCPPGPALRPRHYGHLSLKIFARGHVVAFCNAVINIVRRAAVGPLKEGAKKEADKDLKNMRFTTLRRSKYIRGTAGGRVQRGASNLREPRREIGCQRGGRAFLKLSQRGRGDELSGVRNNEGPAKSVGPDQERGRNAAKPPKIDR
jgi:hypothetical protein